MQIVHHVLGVLVGTVLFTALSFISVILRLVARVFIVHNVFVEDYLIVAASLASFGYLGGVISQIKYGLGKPYDTVDESTAEKFLQSIYATFPLYNAALLLCKLSLILQYRRIFPTKLMRQVSTGLLILLILYGIWTILGSFFMCLPVPFFWGAGEGACMSKAGFWYSNAALNILTDIVIFAIPLFPLRQLQIPREQKMVLMVLFACGAFVCITSAVRLHSLWVFVRSDDPTWDGVSWGIWSAIEINVAISCASIPALKPLFSRRIQERLAHVQDVERKDLTITSDFNDAYEPPVPNPTYPLPRTPLPIVNVQRSHSGLGTQALSHSAEHQTTTATREAFNLAMHVATHPEPTPGTPTTAQWHLGTAEIGVAMTVTSPRPVMMGSKGEVKTNAIVVTPRDVGGVEIYRDQERRSEVTMMKIEEALSVWEGQRVRGGGRRIC